MQRDEAALLDMLRAGRLAQEFRGDLSKEDFFEDLKTQSSVLHQLQIIGEAVKRLSEEFREAHPEIPWRRVAGMRDHLVHAYDAVDVDEIWNTLQSDLPRLITWLEARDRRVKGKSPKTNPAGD